MCGIAGYSLSPASRLDRTLAAQALLTGIAERGADAAGYAWRGPAGRVYVHKQRTGASGLLDEIVVPDGCTDVLLHVRDYTKGHPTIEANNHPIRHGAVVGVHNGVIANDEEIFSDFGFERAEPGMTVDSEAIFALVEHADSRAEALERLSGTVATAWIDERRADALFVARGVGRPLWLGEGRETVFFASTRPALDLVEQALRGSLRKREVDEGTLLVLSDGKLVAQERFEPDRSFREEDPLPPVRAPHEGEFCLERLAVLASLPR